MVCAPAKPPTDCLPPNPSDLPRTTSAVAPADRPTPLSSSTAARPTVLPARLAGGFGSCRRLLRRISVAHGTSSCDPPGLSGSTWALNSWACSSASRSRTQAAAVSRRYLVYSPVVDERGRVLARSVLGRGEVLRASVPMRTGATLYARLGGHQHHRLRRRPIAGRR